MSTTGTTTAIKSVELPGGVEIPYIELGDSGGVPVCFCTDLGFVAIVRGRSAASSGSMHAFALSQRGHGDATRPATGYYPEDFAADLRPSWTSSGSGRLLSSVTRWGAGSHSVSRSTTPIEPEGLFSWARSPPCAAIGRSWSCGMSYPTLRIRSTRILCATFSSARWPILCHRRFSTPSFVRA